jgi:hypothetical protein
MLASGSASSLQVWRLARPANAQSTADGDARGEYFVSSAVIELLRPRNPSSPRYEKVRPTHLAQH